MVMASKWHLKNGDRNVTTESCTSEIAVATLLLRLGLECLHSARTGLTKVTFSISTSINQVKKYSR